MPRTLNDSLLAGGLALLCGCTAYSSPARPVGESRNLDGDALVFVEEDAAEEYLTAHSALIEDLHASGLFDQVRRGRPADPEAALSIRPEWPEDSCVAMPALTVLTAGLWPHISCVVVGYRFSLTGPGVSRETIIDTRHTHTKVWGWAAVIVAWMPGWSGRLSEDDRRDALTAALIDAMSNR